MAAAVKISGAVWPPSITGRLGPYQDSSGNIWVIALDSTPHVVAYKSSDGGATWTSIATSTTFGNFSLDTVYDGNNTIYALVQNSSHVLQVWKFVISTTTWSDLYVSGTKPTVLADVNSRFPAFITLRSTGEIVVAYQGPLHSSTHRSVLYARFSTGGAWSAGTEVDAANATVDYSVKGAVLGASDRVHIFFTNSSSAATHRSVSSSNVLDTAVSTNGTGGVLAETAFIGTGYDSTNTKVIWGVNSTTANIRFPTRASSAATPTFTTDATAVDSTFGLSSATGSPHVYIYDPTGAMLWVFYQGTGADLATNVSPNVGTSWATTGTIRDTATQVSGISVNLYSSTFLYVYGDSGVFFDKLTIKYAMPCNFQNPGMM